MTGSALVLFFQVSSLVGSGLTAIMLFRSGLYRRYRVFFWYFLFRIANGTWPLVFKTRSAPYFWLYVISEPLTWAFYILVVRELFGLVLENHKGVKTLVRWAMYFSMAASVTLSILSLLPRFTPATPQRSVHLGLILATDRGVTFSLAIFLILMMFFLSRNPVPLGRNVVIHAALFTTFFLSNTLSVLLKSVFGLQLYAVADTVLMAVASACVFAWFFLLNPDGERVRRSLPAYGPDSEQRILLHLDSLNRTLLKISRK